MLNMQVNWIPPYLLWISIEGGLVTHSAMGYIDLTNPATHFALQRLSEEE